VVCADGRHIGSELLIAGPALPSTLQDQVPCAAPCSRSICSTAYSSTVHQPHQHLLLPSPVSPWLPDSSCCNRHAQLGSSLATAASRKGQEQRRQPRPQPGNAADDDDDLLLDPKEAAKLRKLLKAKARDAVLDNDGILKVPVDGAAPAAGAAGSRPRRQRRAGFEEQSTWLMLPVALLTELAAAAAAAAAVAALLAAAAVSPESSLTQSMLQAAAPGSGGTKAALPIVRPSTGDTSSSTGSSSSSSRGGRQQRGSTRSSIPAAAFFSRQSWQDLGASADLTAALQSLGITQPSHIQSEAFGKP